MGDITQEEASAKRIAIQTKYLHAPFWILTLNMSQQKANTLLRYRDHNYNWQHYPLYSDSSNYLYFSRKIIKATNNTGTVVIEQPPNNLFETRVKTLMMAGKKYDVGEPCASHQPDEQHSILNGMPTA